MLKLFLVIALMVSNDLLHAGLAQGLKVHIAQFRANLARESARLDALSALKDMVKVEVSLPATQVMEDFDVSFVLGEREVSAGLLAELMVREYNLRTLALTRGTRNSLIKEEASLLSDQLHAAEIGLDLRFAPEAEGILHQSNDLLKYYKAKYMADRPKLNYRAESIFSLDPPEKVLANLERIQLAVRQGRDQSFMLELMEKYGSDMTARELSQRFRRRWALAKDHFSTITDTLDHVSLNQTQLDKLLTADLNVSWDISSRVVVPNLGQTVSPSLIALAKVFEFAARVVAFAERDTEAVTEILLKVVDMKTLPDDNVIMKVSTSEDSYPIRLDEHSLEEIAELYLQQVN